MSVLLAVLGTVLIVVAVVDALWTALWVDRAGGPVTSRVSSRVWQGALRVARHRHGLLSAAGPAILVGTVVGWVLALWAGWVLVYAADGEALLSTRDEGYADWSGRVWFVGYAFFTMGNGDFSPQGAAWQVVSALVNASGMFLVTMAITYLLSVISAVTHKRAFASSVHGLGRTGTELVLAGWDGRDLHALDRQLAGFATQLSQLTEKYLAYPVLQYYHASQAQKSPALAVGVLDDAVLLLSHGVSDAVRPDVASLTATRSSISTYLETLDAAFIAPASEPPPLPALQELDDAGVPTVVDEQQFADRVADDDDRRRRVLGLVHNDGWDWWRG